MRDFALHNRDRYHPIARKFWMQYHEIHTADLYAIVLLEHITIKILLKTIMNI